MLPLGSHLRLLWAAGGWLPWAASSPVSQLLYPQFWFGQQRQQQRIGALERKSERESERERERETERFNPSCLYCQAAVFYGDWFPLPQGSNSHSCHSHQVLGSPHFPISHCSFGQTGNKGVQHLLVPECFTVPSWILLSYLHLCK